MVPLYSVQYCSVVTYSGKCDSRSGQSRADTSLVELQVEDVGVALLGHRRHLRQVRAHLVGQRVEDLEVRGEREGPVVQPPEVLLHQHRGLPEGVQGRVELILEGGCSI